MLRTLSIILYVLSLTLSAAILIFSAVSWILMKKWRQFSNFVFISFIVSSVNLLSWMYAWGQMEELSLLHLITTLIIVIAYIQTSHWQQIISIMIYKDLVNVFNSNSIEVRCKYLVACLFAWLLPVIESAVMVFTLDYLWISWSVVGIIEMSLIAVNVVFYVRLVYTLVRLMKTQKISARDMMGRLLVSTLVCVTTGVVPIVCIIFVIYFPHYDFESLLDYQNLVTLLLANLYFIWMKSHRLIWAEYISTIENTRRVEPAEA